MFTSCIQYRLTQCNEDMWFPAFSCKWKVDSRCAETSCRFQASHICVLDDMGRSYISTFFRFMGGDFLLVSNSPWFSWGSSHVSCSILKRKPFDISRCSHPPKFFFHTLLVLRCFRVGSCSVHHRHGHSCCFDAFLCTSLVCPMSMSHRLYHWCFNVVPCISVSCTSVSF